MTDFINEIKRSISHEDHPVAGTYGKYVRYVEPNDPENEGDPLTTFLKWGHRAEVVFLPYLQLHHERWLTRLFARINRWVNEEQPNRLASRYDV